MRRVSSWSHIGLISAVVLLLTGTAFLFPALAEESASGAKIEVKAGSGMFQLVGGEIQLEALVTRDKQPLAGREVMFWIVTDPAKPKKMKKEATTPSTFLLTGVEIPELGIKRVEVKTDANGIATVPYRSLGKTPALFFCSYFFYSLSHPGRGLSFSWNRFKIHGRY